jgi:hypothetical protein
MRWMGILGLFAAQAAESGNYNMPDAVTTIVSANEVAKKMTTAVAPDLLADFQKNHPAAFWVFGEDRQQAVRKGVIPAHWFADGARHYQQFSGVAQPGEFYVFQACLLGAPALHAEIVINTLPGAAARVISPQGRTLDVFWLGVQIPENAKPGRYPGEVRFTPAATTADAATPVRLRFTIEVKGAPVADGGTHDAWRLARLQWLDSTIAASDTEVTRPFLPVSVDETSRTLAILGRKIRLDAHGIPAQFTSHFSASNTKLLPQGTEAFAAPPSLDCIQQGKVLPWKSTEFRFLKKTPVAASWRARSESGNLRLTVTGECEYDGHLQLRMTLENPTPTPVLLDDVRFVVPWRAEIATYAMGLGLRGGLCPPQHDWKWDVSKHQDAVWMGDVNIGAMMRFKDSSNFRRPLINAYYDFSPLELPHSWGGGGVRWETSAATTTLTAHAGGKNVSSAQPPWHFDIDWYFTPFKPLDGKKHFSDRYFHSGQGSPVEDTAKLKQEGATILEIHHNRLCNPYINYPYNDDSIKHLKDFVNKAHRDDMRVALYYTTRELTQNLPEFYALLSMGGEIILPRKAGVAWPVTNRSGPHPWLLENADDQIVPAWRENLRFAEYPSKLDLAVITTPDSRWNNFYLEGLQYLVKNVGIDGLYIDDTALDRKSMQRARRILDADGNTGRRVSMHSWSHFNGLAKWSNSSIAFMELYPYYDGLWHGEGFNANTPPEFMLVEMSGIPYGLMSEMLDHPNPWHGMVFGMRTRWPWSGDPRAQWRFEQQFGIEDAEFFGWWDRACPVKVDHPDCKVSVYRKQGKTLIALSSWAKSTAKVKLQIDWPALGLSPQKSTLWAPACEKFQNEAVFAPDGEIRVESNKGWMLIVDETPREILLPTAMKNPREGLRELASAPAWELKVPANTVSTKDLAWVRGATVAMANIHPQQDAGQSWGLGLAIGWAGGSSLQINARTDGRWSIRRNGQEMLEGDCPTARPATLAFRLTTDHVQILASSHDGEWELVKAFPRSEFPGDPTTVRYGKIGTSWNSKAHPDPGPTHPCRVEWVKLY